MTEPWKFYEQTGIQVGDRFIPMPRGEVRCLKAFYNSTEKPVDTFTMNVSYSVTRLYITKLRRALQGIAWIENVAPHCYTLRIR